MRWYGNYNIINNTDIFWVGGKFKMLRCLKSCSINLTVVINSLSTMRDSILFNIKPHVLHFLASGKPTYPRPTTATIFSNREYYLILFSYRRHATMHGFRYLGCTKLIFFDRIAGDILTYILTIANKRENSRRSTECHPKSHHSKMSGRFVHKRLKIVRSFKLSAVS